MFRAKMNLGLKQAIWNYRKFKSTRNTATMVLCSYGSSDLHIIGVPTDGWNGVFHTPTGTVYSSHRLERMIFGK
jgi:hypothetical protein